MLSLVNYGSSGSENEISDEEDEVSPQKHQEVAQTPSISLPQPSTQKSHIAEEDDEFLHKKAVPSADPPKKEKVKITIPRLSDFKDIDDDDDKPRRPQPANKKSGLLSMLPRPSNSFAPAPKPTKPVIPKQLPVNPQPQSQGPPAAQAKKVGLIPYALMAHKPKEAAESKKPTKKKEEDSDDEDHVGSFFTFDSKDDELPQVNEEEVKALVDRETARMEHRKRQQDETESAAFEAESFAQEIQNQKSIDEEAMRALLGGNKAKRSKLDNIEIIDLSASEVLPNKDEWRRRNLAGETSYMPTGNIVEKGPNALAKRKHQISFLSMRAENNEAELEAMWAANRNTKRESKSKYGF